MLQAATNAYEAVFLLLGHSQHGRMKQYSFYEDTAGMKQYSFYEDTAGMKQDSFYEHTVGMKQYSYC